MPVLGRGPGAREKPTGKSVRSAQQQCPAISCRTACLASTADWSRGVAGGSLVRKQSSLTPNALPLPPDSSAERTKTPAISGLP